MLHSPTKQYAVVRCCRFHSRTGTVRSQSAANPYKSWYFQNFFYPSPTAPVQRDVYTRHQQLFPRVTKFLKNYFCDFRVINLIHEHKYDMLNPKEDGDDHAKTHSEKA